MTLWQKLAIFAAIVLLIGAIVSAFPAEPHESPKGWKYPSDCCSQDGKECHRVEPGEIAMTPSGYAYRGKVFPYGYPGIKQSGDGDWHVCETVTRNISNGSEYRSIHCVIVPEGGQS